MKRVVRAGQRALYGSGLLSTDRLRLPDFLGLGPGQTGSTWLHRHLSAHPELFLPPLKELNFFDRRLHDWSLARYASCFDGAAGRVAGEITPGYAILRPDRIAFVRRVMPDVRLILTVRDPVERSWSAARRVFRKLETTPERMGEARLFDYLRTEWAYRPKGRPAVTGDYQPGLLEGHYSRILDNWLAHFPPDRVLVVFFGRIVEDPAGLLATVCRHLGVAEDPGWDPARLRRPVNRNPRMEMPAPVRRFLEEMYADELERLRARLGEPARRWLSAPDPHGSGPG